MDDWEKIEYKPISVRDLLVEIKNLSELMLDLAYSSALFHSTELAEDVLELEKKVDTLTFLLQMNTMIAARDAKDAEDLLGVSIVSSSANKISDAAADIAYIVLRDIGIHPLVREVFERVEEQLGRVWIRANSILINKTLDELDFAAEMGVDIIAIRRNQDWIIDPNKDISIFQEDILIARGTLSGIEELKKLAKGKPNAMEE
jgi:uncharacterized protein with PhoU and TrkA domain